MPVHFGGTVRGIPADKQPKIERFFKPTLDSFQQIGLTMRFEPDADDFSRISVITTVDDPVKYAGLVNGLEDTMRRLYYTPQQFEDWFSGPDFKG